MMKRESVRIWTIGQNKKSLFERGVINPVVHTGSSTRARVKISHNLTRTPREEKQKAAQRNRKLEEGEIRPKCVRGRREMQRGFTTEIEVGNYEEQRLL